MFIAIRAVAIVVLANLAILLINIPDEFAFGGGMASASTSLFLIYQIFKLLKA